jgi:regulator of sirC expression with transglutaminase-like and TPR domain
VQSLLEALKSDTSEARLDVPALELATIEFPSIVVPHFVQILDSHAVELSERISDDMDGQEFVEIANDYLFEELGFTGNDDDYYNAHNSCLNEVLAHRTGIPISLAIVYMEIARRLSKPVFGVGLPGHFLVKYDDGEYEAYIDVFNGGRLMTAGECLELAAETAGVEVGFSANILEPVGSRQVLIRMLNNLRLIYFRTKEHYKTAEVLNLLIEASPGSAEEHLQRAVVSGQLRRFRSALRDFEEYLRLAPATQNRPEIERQIGLIKKYLMQLPKTH